MVLVGAEGVVESGGIINKVVDINFSLVVLTSHSIEQSHVILRPLCICLLKMHDS